MASFQQTLWAVQPISSGAIRQKSVGESIRNTRTFVIHLCKLGGFSVVSMVHTYYQQCCYVVTVQSNFNTDIY